MHDLIFRGQSTWQFLLISSGYGSSRACAALFISIKGYEGGTVNKILDPRSPPPAPLKFEDPELAFLSAVRTGLRRGSRCRSRRSTKRFAEQAACHVGS